MRPWTAWLLAAALAACAQPPAAERAPLLGTYWRAIEIEGAPYSAPAGAREIHLVFSGERVSGFTGCNSLSGGFEQDAGSLRFKALAMTRMACLPVMALEARFVSALNATASQHIAGTVLELRDKQGKVRVRLEARNPD